MARSYEEILDDLSPDFLLALKEIADHQGRSFEEVVAEALVLLRLKEEQDEAGKPN